MFNFSLQPSLLNQTYRSLEWRNLSPKTKCFDFLQILPTSTIENVERTGRTIYMLTLGRKGLNKEVDVDYQIEDELFAAK